MDKHLTKKMLSKQYEFLGQGSGRMVFALNSELVMKVPRTPYGVIQNATENYIYTHAEERFKKYLCPVVRHRPDLLIAVRAIPLEVKREYFSSLRMFCDDIEFYRDILELSKKFHIFKRDVKAMSSWGMIDKQKVMIDYGMVTRDEQEENQ